MREIKFRAWDNVDYMSTPFSLLDLQAKKIQFTSDVIVMQFTGLKDKNGKDIYEGDIYKTWYSRDTTGKDIIHIVESVTFQAEPYREKAGYEILFLHNAEIIGNIYENPELMISDKNDERSVARKAK